MARIKRRPGTIYRGLVPNAKGAERAAKTNCDEMVGLITVSKTYLAKNQNMELETAIDQAIAAYRIADEAGARFVMALGMAFWCPYEGRIPEAQPLAAAQRFSDAGIRRTYFTGSVALPAPPPDHPVLPPP